MVLSRVARSCRISKFLSYSQVACHIDVIYDMEMRRALHLSGISTPAVRCPALGGQGRLRLAEQAFSNARWLKLPPLRRPYWT